MDSIVREHGKSSEDLANSRAEFREGSLHHEDSKGNGSLAGKSDRNSVTPSGSGSASSLNEQYDDKPLGGQAQYMVQERAYLHRLRSSMFSDYYERKLNPVGQVGREYEDEHHEDSGDEEEGAEDLFSLDDVDQSTLQSSDLILSPDSHNIDKADKIKERTEWQIMLTSVLTGEIFMSEKSRLEYANSSSNASREQLWLELKAKVTCRSVSEQQRVLAIGRSTVHDILDRIMTFKLSRAFESIEEPFCEVEQLIDLLERCEALFPNLQAMREYSPVYASEAFETRIHALTAWYTVTQSILTELSILQEWTGNAEADPTLPPDNEGSLSNDDAELSEPNESEGNRYLVTSEERLCLVRLVMRREGSLESIFKRHIECSIFKLLDRIRDCTIEYSSEFVDMGLPLFLLGLGPVIAFPVKIIREIMELRLNAAAKIHNPTMIMIDEAIEKFETYMQLGFALTQQYIKVTEPVLDKGWIFTNRSDISINGIMLRCIKFYLDLLSNKFLDGGSSSMSFFRNFKSIEELNTHFKNLQATCKLIEGGDISVAEQFSSLHARILSRLLAYWEHQMEGPPKRTKNDIDRWFASTIENIRSIQRKLLRFYHTLSNTYENATEITFPPEMTREFLEHLRNMGAFLVLGGSSDQQGCYTFATANLREKPLVIRNLMMGHARPPQLDEEPGAIILVTLTEALRWDGDIYQLEFGHETLPPFNGQARIVTQGGSFELQEMRGFVLNFENAKICVLRRSHLEKVDGELHKMRMATYRLAMTVITSAIQFRHKTRKYNCQETIQAMFTFAKEFGKRGLPLVSEPRRSKIITRLFDLCVEWVEFVSDDCPPKENKTFKWTVQALEFAMMMTHGVNILAVRESQFLNLRRKVADCVTLLISHFDIMGARSKAANLTNHHNRARLQHSMQNRTRTNAKTALKDDSEVIAAHRVLVLDKINTLEAKLSTKYNHGKVLDQHNTNFEFLSFASSKFTAMSMRWQRGELIGVGGSGSVFKVTNDNFQVMAAKEVRITTTERVRLVLENLQQEMTALEMVSHPNIVQYYGAELHRDCVYIFMEYCPHSLANLLEQGRIEDDLIIQYYSLQMLEGLAYLHQSGIVHRDIKPENILIKDWFIKIVDFGAAKIIVDRCITAVQTKRDFVNGTPMYMAPEVIKNDKSANLSSVDIWSLGCVILKMAAGYLPWGNIDNVFSIMYYIGSNRCPEIPDNGMVSPECRAILERTLQYEPQKRPTAMVLLRNPWFDSAREALKEFLENRNDNPEVWDESAYTESFADSQESVKLTSDTELSSGETQKYVDTTSQADGSLTETKPATFSKVQDATSINDTNDAPAISSSSAASSTEHIVSQAMDTIKESEYEYDHSQPV